MNAFHWQGQPSIFTQNTVEQQRKSLAQENRERLSQRNTKIAQMYASGVSRRELAREFDLNPHTVALIIRHEATRRQ